MNADMLGNTSNEKREQTMMQLRTWFNHKQVLTVDAARQKLGVTYPTIVKYCVDGDIPLWDTHLDRPVVTMTDHNRPHWWN